MNYPGWAYFKKFYLIINNKEGKINPQDLPWGEMSGAQNARRGSCRMFITFSKLINVFICGRQADLTVAKEIVCEVYCTLFVLGILRF